MWIFETFLNSLEVEQKLPVTQDSEVREIGSLHDIVYLKKKINGKGLFLLEGLFLPSFILLITDDSDLQGTRSLSFKGTIEFHSKFQAAPSFSRKVFFSFSYYEYNNTRDWLLD